MRVFVTGAAGFIGRAVVQELINHGHQVLGLARSDASAELITKAGGLPHRGDLEDLESLKSGARAADGVIHLAFVHDFSNMAKCTAIDRAAIEAMGEAMAGTGKPLVIASGILFLPKGKLTTEDTEPDRNHPFAERGLSADLVYQLSKEKNIRGSVIRLSPTVHGKEDKGFIPALINLARQKGFVTYVSDGSARWPAVHRLDAAVLFRLALEKGTAGATYHAVAEQAIPIKDIMTVIGKHLQLPVESKSLNEAAEAIGFFAHVISSDNPTSSEKTQKELGWHPSQPKLLDDIEANYFSSESKAKYSS
ncbi:unnamed protein product [Adineta steineri]|uniref:NAD-dependent epimerase/dehydratase domain-containing protein n=1 Tax=Adineta steineri TaxID=433720 RepID=A0A819L0D0_9BILA|nr:unnamed protein product [Adineta steineri]CAF3954861.1 unnamed protein product [Adineta steineri]